MGQTVTAKGVLDGDKVLASRKGITGQLNLSWTSLRRGQMWARGFRQEEGCLSRPVCAACRVIMGTDCGSREAWTLLRVSPHSRLKACGDGGTRCVLLSSLSFPREAPTSHNLSPCLQCPATPLSQMKRLPQTWRRP